MVHDPQVVAAAWDESDQFTAKLVEPGAHSVLVQRGSGSADQRSARAQGLFPDGRVAQLPDDPFEEPLPEPESEPVEEAVQGDLERQETEYDPFDDSSLEQGPLDEPEEVDTNDPFDQPSDTEAIDQEPEPNSDQEPDQEPESNNLDLDFGLTNEEDQALAKPTEEERAAQLKQIERERLQIEKNCEQEYAKLKANRINSIELNIRVPGNAGEDYPLECALGAEQFEQRRWPQITYTWKAAGLCHKPLYFEQVQLERYGHSWGPYLQPFMSGVHFFGMLPILPYQMGLKTPNECVYTLGYFRPGSGAPYLLDPIPFTWRAAIFEAGTAVGITAILP